MENLVKAGRIFYGLAMVGVGIHQLFYGLFCVMLVPPWPVQHPLYTIAAYVGSIALAAAGLAIVFEKRTQTVSLALGFSLLVLLCLSYIPYEFLYDPYYHHLAMWTNAFKELAFAGGAFVLAGLAIQKHGTDITTAGKGLTRWFIAAGPWFFAATMICFGTMHFLYLNGVAGLVPAWMPFPVFWTALAGTALIGSGISIVSGIKVKLVANLLGLMILIWFFILHIPRAIATPLQDNGNEITSAFSALAFCGTAFSIANRNRLGNGR